MDDFNNMNNSNMPEGEINGFDSAKNSETGYTVTPKGSFYTKKQQDIIQDEVIRPEPAFQSGGAQQNTYAENINSQPQFQQAPNYSYGYNSYNQGFYKSPKPKKEKKPKKYGAGLVLTAVLMAAVIGGVVGAGAAVLSYNAQPPVVVESDDKGQTNVNINIDETAESVVEAVATKVTPSVVGIRTTTSIVNFFGGSSDSTGEGSGVIYTEDGYIITNYHVISEAITNKSNSKIDVFIDSADSDSYEAKVVGYNISSDLAVIKIDATGLTAVEVTDSEELKVGQYVITIGNPGGLEFMDSVTYGVVSGLNRVVSSDSGVELIQTDAAINPGNSGGALVNTKGELVGINSSKIVSEEYEGMGFAIPSNTVVDICEKIISKENSPEPYIGLTISERYTSSVLEFYGFPNGAVILSVAQGSPAADAGIQKGDIITEYKGSKITEYGVLEQLMEESEPGENITVKFYRGGRNYSTTITVGSNNQVD